MDIYSRKSRWKVYLAVAGVIIVIITMVYTRYLANLLAEEEQRKVNNWLMAIEHAKEVDEEEDFCDYTLHTAILKSNMSIPAIIVNDRGGIDWAINFRGNKNTDEEFLKKQVAKMQARDFEPIQGFAFSIYYKESRILRQVRFFPVVQLGLIGAFILFGYTAFNSARRAEQNRVWVGMAKETAHQLGTPITAIVGWIENLKLIREDDNEVQMILGELRNDVSRLNLIADRFSKIGSEPNYRRSMSMKNWASVALTWKREHPGKLLFIFRRHSISPR